MRASESRCNKSWQNQLFFNYDIVNNASVWLDIFEISAQDKLLVSRVMI